MSERTKEPTRTNDRYASGSDLKWRDTMTVAESLLIQIANEAKRAELALADLRLAGPDELHEVAHHIMVRWRDQEGRIPHAVRRVCEEVLDGERAGALWALRILSNVQGCHGGDE